MKYNITLNSWIKGTGAEKEAGRRGRRWEGGKGKEGGGGWLKFQCPISF